MILPIPTRTKAAGSATARHEPQEQLRILVVEEEPWLTILLNRALIRRGFSLDSTDDARTACARAASRSYDAILLGLSGLDGTELCSQLRSAQITSPIMIVDIRGTVDDVVTGLSAGADDYIAGPIYPDELMARLHALRRRYLLSFPSAGGPRAGET